MNRAKDSSESPGELSGENPEELSGEHPMLRFTSYDTRLAFGERELAAGVMREASCVARLASRLTVRGFELNIWRGMIT
jgi:hypothetical protein